MPPGTSLKHLEYFPFGETWVQEASKTQRMPYLFTAKELDEETGLDYICDQCGICHWAMQRLAGIARPETHPLDKAGYCAKGVMVRGP
jgi:hypothetical protein